MRLNVSCVYTIQVYERPKSLWDRLSPKHRTQQFTISGNTIVEEVQQAFDELRQDIDTRCRDREAVPGSQVEIKELTIKLTEPYTFRAKRT